MIVNDKILGQPITLFTDIESSIEAITGMDVGAIAYTTDTHKLLIFNGTIWVQVTGGGTGTLPSGINTGDFIRFNASSEQWEIAEEPIELKGLVLTPALASLVDAEGAIYYDSSTKSIMVCTDI